MKETFNLLLILLLLASCSSAIIDDDDLVLNSNQTKDIYENHSVRYDDVQALVRAQNVGTRFFHSQLMK